MMAALLLSSCATTIHDARICSLIPVPPYGASCDNFLTHEQQILDEPGWEALKAQWNAEGSAVACTTSRSIGELKAEIEKLCSTSPCNAEQKQKLLEALSTIQGASDKVLLR